MQDAFRPNGWRDERRERFDGEERIKASGVAVRKLN